MELKNLKKDPVAMGIIAVLAVVVVFAALGFTGVSGMVSSDPVSLILVETGFPVTADLGVMELRSNWGACDKFEAGAEGAKAICTDHGFVDLAPAVKKPCRYGNAGTTYAWDGMVPMTRGGASLAGYALNGVLCVK